MVLGGTTLENEQQLTPEQFQVRVLKQRFAERITEYEEEIANLYTQVAQLQQQLRQSTEQGEDVNVVAAD